VARTGLGPTRTVFAKGDGDGCNLGGSDRGASASQREIADAYRIQKVSPLSYIHNV